MTQTDQEQDAELADHQHRLERLEQVFPTPETPRGGAQRARLHVPNPDSLLTVGAAGHATSEGRAEGPGGVALHTVENLGAQIQGSTILHTDGNTILHTGEEARVLAEADAAISSNANVKVGSIEDVEITAGGAGFTDPAFTVRPAMAVPSPPVVDTAGPRETLEAVKEGWKRVWQVWSIRSAIKTWGSFLTASTEEVQGASLQRNAATFLGVVRSSTTLGEALWEGLVLLADAFEDPHAMEHTDSGPQMKMHAAGGMSLSSDGKISAFSPLGVSVGGGMTVSLKAGSSASLSAGGNAKLYGIASASVASDGVVGIKGKVVGTGGDYIEMKAKRAASLKSEGEALLEAKTKAVIDGESVAVAGNVVSVAAKDDLYVDSKTCSVHVQADQRVDVAGRQMVRLRSEQGVRLHQGDASVILSNDEVSVRSGRMEAKVQSNRFSVGGLFVERGEIRLRGRVRMG